MPPLINLPMLPVWAQQLAGILPLSALIDFIDVPMKLHMFQLTGSDAFWNWTITPMGARLLLARQEPLASCCLDEDGSSAPLHCIDGRYGDVYPSSHPKTLRLCLMHAHETSEAIQNHCPHIDDPSNRLQRLEFAHISRASSGAATAESHPEFLSQHSRSARYRLMAACGWICWLSATIISFMSMLWFAGVFLAVVPLTGCVVYLLHGGSPRTLLSAEPSKYNRMVVCTNSLNGTNWTAFYGQSPTVNSVLNKPLYRTRNASWATTEGLLGVLLQALIATQWVSVLGSCSLQDWNAYVIVLWVVLGIVVSSYIYQPMYGIRDWMAYGADISLVTSHVTFSSRRAVLSALLYLSPDRFEASGTKWIDPILAPSEDRSRWEAALKSYIMTGDADDPAKRSYWWKFVVEGIEIGREVEVFLAKRSNQPPPP